MSIHEEKGGQVPKFGVRRHLSGARVGLAKNHHGLRQWYNAGGKAQYAVRQILSAV